MKVVLHLTKSCNLRCRYCYAPAKVPESMPLDVAKRAIDWAIDTAEGPTACVSYFGGEPLLMFDHIEELTSYACARGESRGKVMHFRMATNGTLFTEDSLKFCRDHNILYAISLDGDEQAHNSMRILPDGSGSFRLIDQKLDMILAHNPLTVVTTVITPSTIDRLMSSMEYMWKRGLRFIVHSLDYTHPDWTPEALNRLAKSYEQVADFYLARVREDAHFHLALFDDKIKTHARSPFKLGVSCDFGARKFSVAPNGRFFPCVQLISDRPDSADYCIGDVGSGFTARRQQLAAENGREREQCRGCAFLGRCTNYCGCLNWKLTGRVYEVGGIVCAHEKMLIPIADRVGNELWSEQNGRFLRKHYDDHARRFVYNFD